MHVIRTHHEHCVGRTASRTAGDTGPNNADTGWRQQQGGSIGKGEEENIKSKLADFFALEFKSVSPPYVFGVGLSTAFEMQIASGSPGLAAGKISEGTLRSRV